MTETETLTRPSERDPTTMPAAAKKPAKKPPSKPRTVAAVPTFEPDMMNDLLLAVHEKAMKIDALRVEIEQEIAESDALIREAVDEGERYRDIAAAAGRTVPWVQMSLRRKAGVSTHPALPIPDTRIRKARRKAS